MFIPIFYIGYGFLFFSQPHFNIDAKKVSNPEMVVLTMSNKTLIKINNSAERKNCQEVHMRFLLLEKDGEGNSTWEMKLEKVVLILGEDKKSRFHFPIEKNHYGKLFFEELIKRQVRAHFQNGKLVIISGFPKKEEKLEGMPLELETNVRWHFSQSHLEFLARFLFLPNAAKYKKGDKWKSQTPSIPEIDERGSINLFSHTLVKNVDNKIIELEWNLEKIQNIPSNLGKNLLGRKKNVKLEIKKGSGSSIFNSQTGQIISANSDNLIEGNWEVELAGNWTKVYIQHVYNLKIRTNK